MINILLLILMLFLFFSYALVSLQFLFPIIAMGVVVVFVFKKANKSINLSSEDILWFLCVGINIIGLIKAPNITEALLFTGFILVFSLLKIVLSNFENWGEFFLKGSLMFSSIHVFSTLMQYFNPEIVQRVNQMILPSGAYNVNTYQVVLGRYAGITGQVGANAFYITIFIAIMFCYLIENKKSYYVYLLVALGFIALVLTAKRGLLLFNIITVISVILVSKFSKFKRDNKAVLISLISLLILSLTIVGFLLISNNPMTSQLLVDDDFTSGRVGIYSLTFELVKLAPLIGNGLSSVEHKIGIKAHNIYLQLWAELGLLGLITYSLAMIVTLMKSIKLYNSMKTVESTGLDHLALFSIYIQIIFLLYGLTGNVLYDYFIVGTYMMVISLPRTVRLSLT